MYVYVFFLTFFSMIKISYIFLLKEQSCFLNSKRLWVLLSWDTQSAIAFDELCSMYRGRKIRKITICIFEPRKICDLCIFDELGGGACSRSYFLLGVWRHFLGFFFLCIYCYIILMMEKKTLLRRRSDI